MHKNQDNNANPAAQLRDYAEEKGVSMRKALLKAGVCDISTFYRWVERGDASYNKLQTIRATIDALAAEKETAKAG